MQEQDEGGGEGCVRQREPPADVDGFESVDLEGGGLDQDQDEGCACPDYIRPVERCFELFCVLHSPINKRKVHLHHLTPVLEIQFLLTADSLEGYVNPLLDEGAV
jgi:hypothetical protein